MCNAFRNRIPFDDYLRAFSQTRIPARWPKAAPNLEPPDDIWPTDTAPVIPVAGRPEFSWLRPGFVAGSTPGDKHCRLAARDLAAGRARLPPLRAERVLELLQRFQRSSRTYGVV
jgi:hypothetical protein